MHALPSKLGFFTLLLVIACNAQREAAEEEALDVIVEGDDGLLTFEIRSEQPVVEGHNDLHVTVLHGGTPFTESSLSATVRMASMTHSGSAPTISSLGDGEFLFHDVTLDMPGQWQISLYAENADQLKIRDTAVLILEVP
jgi:hypothetical protein